MARAPSSSWKNAASAVPPEFSPRDYVIYLLQIDAEIEHSLMVQYLYSAYSLGGPQVPESPTLTTANRTT